MTAFNHLRRSPKPSEDAWPWATQILPTTPGPITFTDVGAGPTMLLVHVGLGSFVWRDLIRELSTDYRCVTLDAPGTGQSYRPGPRGTTLAAAADAVQAVITHLDLREVTLVIHDLGGPAGIAAAARVPDRITAIAAVNTFAWRPTGVMFRGMLAVLGSSPIAGSDALIGWLPAATSGRFGVGRHWNRADRKAFRMSIDREARRSFHRYMADARSAEDLFRVTQGALTGPLMGRPVLIIFGARNDPLKFQPQWRTLFPKAQQHVIEGGYHFPMCDAPTEVADTIRTWRSHSATP